MPANWFIALPVTPTDWLATLPAPPAAVRLFAPDDLHITVAFLGPVGEQRAQAAFALAHAFPLRALAVRVGQVVPLGSTRRPSAYSALVAEGGAEVELAMGSARDALADEAASAREQRPPLAHVTLARPERKATAQQVADGVAWANGLLLETPPLQLTRIALYTRSDEGQQRRFRIVAEHALGRRAAGVDASS